MRNPITLLFRLPWWAYTPLAAGIAYLGEQAYQSVQISAMESIEFAGTTVSPEDAASYMRMAIWGIAGAFLLFGLVRRRASGAKAKTADDTIHAAEEPATYAPVATYTPPAEVAREYGYGYGEAEEVAWDEWETDAEPAETTHDDDAAPEGVRSTTERRLSLGIRVTAAGFTAVAALVALPSIPLLYSITFEQPSAPAMHANPDETPRLVQAVPPPADAVTARSEPDAVVPPEGAAETDVATSDTVLPRPKPRPASIFASIPPVVVDAIVAGVELVPPAATAPAPRAAVITKVTRPVLANRSALADKEPRVTAFVPERPAGDGPAGMFTAPVAAIATVPADTPGIVSDIDGTGDEGWKILALPEVAAEEPGFAQPDMPVVPAPEAPLIASAVQKPEPPAISPPVSPSRPAAEIVEMAPKAAPDTGPWPTVATASEPIAEAVVPEPTLAPVSEPIVTDGRETRGLTPAADPAPIVADAWEAPSLTPIVEPERIVTDAPVTAPAPILAPVPQDPVVTEAAEVTEPSTPIPAEPKSQPEPAPVMADAGDTVSDTTPAHPEAALASAPEPVTRNLTVVDKLIAGATEQLGNYIELPDEKRSEFVMMIGAAALAVVALLIAGLMLLVMRRPAKHSDRYDPRVENVKLDDVEEARWARLAQDAREAA